MKIAITAQSNSPESALDRRFGRAPFIFVGTADSESLVPHENRAGLQPSGAGIAAAQWVIDQGVEVLITGDVGPKAAQVLQAAGVKVHHTGASTVLGALAEYKKSSSSEPAPVSFSSAPTAATPKNQESTPVTEAVVAVATDANQVAAHFGRCQEYTIAIIKGGAVVSRRVITNPGHEPDFLPGFLADQNVSTIIAGGMGSRAVELFCAKDIAVIVGVSGPVAAAIEAFRNGTLQAGESTCLH